MKFQFLTAAAAAMLVVLGGSNIGTAAAIPLEEALAMRTALEDELRLFKIKDRNSRKSGIKKSRANGDGNSDSDSDSDNNNDDEVPLPPKLRAAKANSKIVREGATPMQQKMLAVKMNILNLAEMASPEDLDEMLQIFDSMVQVRDPKDGDVKLAPEKGLNLKKLRHQLDAIADKYGGLKAGRSSHGAHARKQPDGLRAFSEEEARTVKELRRKINEATDPDEAQKLRDELKVQYSQAKFKHRDEARRRKESKREGKVDMTERKAARIAAQRSKRGGTHPTPKEGTKRITRPDKGKGNPLKEKMRKGDPLKPNPAGGKPGITGTRP